MAVALAELLLPAIGLVLHPNSEHAENDGREEGEGYDGSKHVEPRPQFHRYLQCRNEPAPDVGYPAPNRNAKVQNAARPTKFDAAVQ
jgi:hypothetical protein